MDKTIFIIFFCCTLSWAIPAEFGRFTAIQGSVTVSRSTDVVTPIIASRLYDNDTLIVGEKSIAVIRTTDAIITINQPTKAIVQNSQLQTEYGLYSLSIIEDETTTKSMATAMGLTAAYPGAGHFYIRDYYKAIPMSAATAYFLWNIFTINPGQSVTYQEQLSNQKQAFIQIYFVYWLIALLDTYSETNLYNKKVTADDDLSNGEPHVRY